LGASQLILTNSSGGGVILQPNPAASSVITYTLPADLTAGPLVPGGRILQSDASGNLSWLSPTALAEATAWALTGNGGTDPAVNFLGTTDAQPLVIRTNNTERLRVTATGDVVLQNQAAGTPTTVLRVLGGNGGTGATQVVLQAGANQSGVDLLQWRNNNGDLLGVIRPEGSVVLVYDPPTARQAFFAVATPSGVPWIGIGPDPSGWGVGVYEPIAPFGQLRAGMGKVGTQWRMGVGDLAAQNGVLLNWATTGTVDEPRIVVANGSLANPVFLVDREGDVTVRGTTVELPNIPSGSATDVLVWNNSLGGRVERRAASGLISDFAWMLTGNSGTNPAVNFLGTTDAQPLVIRVGNQETFRFNPPGASAPAWSIQRGGGDPRGLHAVDLQSARSAATQVASGDYSVIGGGRRNTASGYAATVGGGEDNTASGTYATVGGGWNNTASSYSATVSGGYQNTASGLTATVGGGRNNTASGQYATVGGGILNTASGPHATVGGGLGNTASGEYSAIPGGHRLQVGPRSFGFSGQTSLTQTDLSANSNIAAFVDVDLWLYSRDRTQASQLRFYEAQAHGSGAEYVAFQAPNTLTTSTTYTLPASLTPTSTVEAGILQTDASGNLSWVSPTALAAATAWMLTGNSGTNPAVNFLGTTDAQPLVIRVDNQETFRFNPPGSSAPAWSIQRGGGNQRGWHAVDLQSARAAATQVASGDYSVIGGGQNNTASGWWATVGGGLQNTASGDLATVGGGLQNTASGSWATVGGGRNNTASGPHATVGGGLGNTASSGSATVGGGGGNTASATYATVGGGQSNTASAIYATVGGGASNMASGSYATVGGGVKDTVRGNFSTVGGGADNTVDGPWSTIAGGGQNYIAPGADYSTISGGGYDTVYAGWGTISGGAYNRVRGFGATVGGGGYHDARGDYSTIAGGTENLTEGEWSTIGGGRWNRTGDEFATVGGGRSNEALGWASTIGGGRGNVNRGRECTIAGGSHNEVQTGALVSTICGGEANEARVDTGSAILGGRWNIVSGKYSAIFGGEGNFMTGTYSVTAGVENYVGDNIVFAFGQNLNIAANESHRAYFFGPNAPGAGGNYSNSGFLVVNRFDGDYPIHVGTNNTNGNGAHLTAGGVWTNGSSRSFKERFVQYRPAEVLERIRQLPVEGYFYKGTEEYHITPMAEDFYRLFGTGAREIIETDSTGKLVRRPNPDVDKYLAASDVAGVALLGVKALDELISTLDPQSTAWALTGNAITGTEFLGTTNAQPLVIRTDNTERMRITETGDVGIGTNTPAATLDVNGTVAFSATATLTNTGSALTLPSNVAVVEIVDGGGAANINVNPPTTGTQGQVLFIRYSGSQNLTLVGVLPGGGNQTATAQFHAILMYIGGGWRLMSFVD
jgi:hypothetical protein